MKPTCELEPSRKSFNSKNKNPRYCVHLNNSKIFNKKFPR